MPDGSKIRRSRTRKERFKLDDERKSEIVARVIRFYDQDMTTHTAEREMRIQRYAKYRMWREGTNWPWENASDVALPDMMTAALDMCDTLHNAVMSARPPVSPKARQKADQQKEEKIEKLIDYQVFEEQPGERALGEIIDNFVLDGTFTAFIPWVTEQREVNDLRIFPPIADDELVPANYFQALIRQVHENAPAISQGDGWDWTVDVESPAGLPESVQVSFYTREDGKVEMSSRRMAVVFNGPKIIPLDWDQVLHPPRAANLQIPGPSNPGGAAHVIVSQEPTKDEIKRLAKVGFYDLVSADDLSMLDNARKDIANDEPKRQKDAMQGVNAEAQVNQSGAKSHDTLTRLMCFDSYDIDGDGIDEDVIWWVIKETKTLLKARFLTEMYPANPPRRPFAEESFIPVAGRRAGIGLLELMEGLHDIQKQLLDQTIDAGTISNVPFGFYRPTSTMKPEIMKLSPGALIPLGNPKQDIEFPKLQNGQQAFGINMLTLLHQMEERLTHIGDLQAGRVPPGRSSALRTTTNMALLASQAEARPERILRRLFSGLAEIWHQIHELNQRFLPEKKKFRISGMMKPGEDPYSEISNAAEISGRFRFGFTANVFNASKMALQQSLQNLMSVYINPLTFQSGIMRPDGAYRLLRDFGKANGLDPDNYLSEPFAGAGLPRLMAEEALTAIMGDSLPEGFPAEGAQAHLQKLQDFEASDQFGMLTQQQVELYRGYKTKIEQILQDEMRQQAMIQAAGQFQQGGQGQGGRPPEQPPSTGETPPVQGGELIDESMPTAGGGAVQ
jgi:hypothetical protein